MPHSPTPSDTLLSIRTSCDRCRSQKLKCIVPKTPNRAAGCQRCARAMVPCVFGRRNKNKRTAPSEGVPKTSQHQPPTELQDAAPITPPHITYPEVMDGGMGVGDPLLLHGADSFPFYDMGVALSREQLLDSKQDTTRQLHRGLLVHTYNDEETMANLKLFGYDIPCPGQDQHRAPTSHPDSGLQSSTSDWNSSSSDSDPFAEFFAASKPRTSSASLLYFAAYLHERLEMLESEPSWRRENARMDDYPIGSVLELSKKLQSLGITMQKSKCNEQTTFGVQVNSDMGDIGGEQQHLNQSSDHTGDINAVSTTSSPRFETSASLILLSCYVTLLQICTVVMGHFQEYLMAQPNLRPRARSSSVPQTPVVCLGDLLPLNQSHDRIHTAIYMLLNSLEQVEEALCLPPQVRYASTLQFTSTPNGQTSEHSEFPFDLEQRNLEIALMHWSLFSNAGGIRSVLSDLGRKVKDTKEMLRHHMDL